MTQKIDEKQAKKYQKLAEDYMDIWQDEWAAICAAGLPETLQNNSYNMAEDYAKMIEMQKDWLLQISAYHKGKKNG